MMNRLMIFLSSLCSLGLCLQPLIANMAPPPHYPNPGMVAMAPTIELPPEFYIRQHWLSWTTTFDIETAGYKLGTVHRKLLTWTVEYDFYNFLEELEANARMRFFSFGAVFDVSDRFGQPIGEVNEKIFTFFPTFEILSPQGEILAIAQLNFWGTKYELTDPLSGRTMAKISRAFFRLKDDWKVEIENPHFFNMRGIDHRLFVLVAAFQTDMDYWRSQLNQNNFAISGTLNLAQHYAAVNFTPSIILPVDLKSTRVQLEAYRPNLNTVEPSEDDLKIADEKAEKILREYEKSSGLAHDTAFKHLQDSKELTRMRAKHGVEALLPLLEDSSMTVGQKSALFLMLDAQLKSQNE